MSVERGRRREEEKEKKVQRQTPKPKLKKPLSWTSLGFKEVLRDVKPARMCLCVRVYCCYCRCCFLLLLLQSVLLIDAGMHTPYQSRLFMRTTFEYHNDERGFLPFGFF